jgi:hypothetical protein
MSGSASTVCVLPFTLSVNFWVMVAGLPQGFDFEASIEASGIRLMQINTAVSHTFRAVARRATPTAVIC